MHSLDTFLHFTIRHLFKFYHFELSDQCDHQRPQLMHSLEATIATKNERSPKMGQPYPLIFLIVQGQLHLSSSISA